MAEVIRTEPDTHLYGPVLGLPALRSEIAWRSSALYGGEIRPDEVAVTAGCNQAFCTAIMTLAAPGDAVLLPVPWYFNHKMWLDMSGIEAIPLPCGPGMLPDPARRPRPHHPPRPRHRPRHPQQPHRRRIPARAHRRVRRHRPRQRRRPHPRRDLPRLRQPRRPPARPLHRPRLARHPRSSSTPSPNPSTSPATAPARSIASAARLAEAEKVLDSMTICAPQLGQKAALWGLRNLADWVAAERAEILRRRDAARAALSALPGWRILGCGAYFAYVEHPHPLPSERARPPPRPRPLPPHAPRHHVRAPRGDDAAPPASSASPSPT